MPEQEQTDFSNEEILIIARSVAASLTEASWEEIGQEEQQGCQDDVREILAALESELVIAAIARYVYDHKPGGNMPPTYDLADALVQTNYYNEVFAVIEHLLQNRTLDIGKYKQST